VSEEEAMHHRLAQHFRGQALPLMALFSVLIFGLVGFTIDGGLLYMQRRVMQNTADAACLAAANRIALKQDSAAVAAAQEIIKKSLGDPSPGTGAVNAPGTLAYAAVGDVYNNTSLSGSGVNLTHGIQVSNSDVRVALRSPANTFFMRVLGISQYTVAARAHCNSVGGGGGTPFAVARWRGYKNSSSDDPIAGLTTAKQLPQPIKQNSNANMYVRDLLAQSTSSNITQWPGWVNALYPGDPLSGNSCCLYSNATIPATVANPGFETVIAGVGANPNVGSPAFSGPIVLDLRNMTGSPTYYYPFDPTTSLQQYKDLIAKYILGDYTGPVVQPGDQVAYYNGISAGLIYDTFSARYKVGDIITTLIYNGTIYGDPGASLTVVPDKENRTNRSESATNRAKCNIDNSAYMYGESFASSMSPAQYNLTLSTSNLYNMRAFLSSPGNSFANAKGTWASSGWAGFDSNGIGPKTSANSSSFTFKFEQGPSGSNCTTTGATPTTYTLPDYQSGARTIYLESEDAGTHYRRGRYVFAALDPDTTDFYPYFAGEIIYTPMQRGEERSVDFLIENVQNNGDPGNGISIDPTSSGVISFDWCSYDSSVGGTPSCSESTANGDTNSAGIQATVIKPQSNKNKYSLKIDVSDTATENEEFYLRINVTSGGVTRSAWYYINVIPAISNSIKNYVYILGYGEFKITEITNNYVKGQAVSGLLKPSDLKTGFQPRLLPW
jgi:Flp pilus assembly protein TadG